MPVFGNVSYPQFATGTRAFSCNILPFKLDFTRKASGANQSRQGLDKFRLSVSLNSCYANNFTFADLKRNIVNALASIIGDNGQTLDDQFSLTNLCLTLFHSQQHFSPYH